MRNIFYFILGFISIFTIGVQYADASEFVTAVIYNPVVDFSVKIALEIKEFDTGKIRFQAVMFNADQVVDGKLLMWRYKREEIDPFVKVDSEIYKLLILPSHIIMGKK